MGYLEMLDLLHLSSVVQFVYQLCSLLTGTVDSGGINPTQGCFIIWGGGQGFLRSQTRRFGLAVNNRTDRTTNDSALEQLVRNWIELPEEMTERTYDALRRSLESAEFGPTEEPYAGVWNTIRTM